MHNERDSSIELLRIISIIMIMFHHLAVHSNFSFPVYSMSLNKLWVLFISGGGKLGVNLFILITGYFLIIRHDVDFNYRHILRLWIQIITYSVGILIFFIFFIKIECKIPLIVKSFTPVLSNVWWFATCYFLLYIFHGYINLIISQLSRRSHFKLIFLMVVIWSILPTFFGFKLYYNELF